MFDRLHETPWSRWWGNFGGKEDCFDNTPRYVCGDSHSAAAQPRLVAENQHRLQQPYDRHFISSE